MCTTPGRHARECLISNSVSFCVLRPGEHHLPTVQSLMEQWVLHGGGIVAEQLDVYPYLCSGLRNFGREPPQLWINGCSMVVGYNCIGALLQLSCPFLLNDSQGHCSRLCISTMNTGNIVVSCCLFHAAGKARAACGVTDAVPCAV